MKRYKKIILVVLFAMFFSSSAYSLGLGVVLGEPTGLSFKYKNIAGAAAWSLKSDYLHVHGDYWLFNRNLSSPLKWYVGLGLYAGLGDDITLGFRVPVGLNAYFARRFEVFGELVPSISAISDVDFNLQGGIGLRYHF